MNTLPNIQKRNYTTLERIMAETMREMQLRQKNKYVEYNYQGSWSIMTKYMNNNNSNEKKIKEEHMKELRNYIKKTPHLKDRGIIVKNMKLLIPKEYAIDVDVHKLFGKSIGKKTKPNQFIFGYPNKPMFHMLPLNEAREQKKDFQKMLDKNEVKFNLLRHGNFQQLPLNIKRKIIGLLHNN